MRDWAGREAHSLFTAPRRSERGNAMIRPNDTTASGATGNADDGDTVDGSVNGSSGATHVRTFPRSTKVYVTGSRPDVRVPFREVGLDPTRHPLTGNERPNPPVRLYDTSGPYTDPEARIDVRQGLPALRQEWIVERGDTEELPGTESRYARERELDEALDAVRFVRRRRARRARAGQNVSQMHYARRGDRSRRRWSTSPSARTSGCQAMEPELLEAASGTSRSAPTIPERHHA